ncbi:hypothetical protein NQ648_18500, partial [Acinetobacter baumannii]|nr:hypothetical protein [Acinetobacter baumannii]
EGGRRRVYYRKKRKKKESHQGGKRREGGKGKSLVQEGKCACVWEGGFFQAEEGRRDLVRERGRGEGYKRKGKRRKEEGGSWAT